MRSSNALSLMLAAAMALPVAAQIAPQPPKTPEQQDLAEPPPPPTPAKPRLETQITRIPDPDFNVPAPIVVDGRTWIRPEPTDLLSLAYNPLLDVRTLASLAPKLSDRRQSMQDLMLAHPENAEQMLSPTFTQIDLQDPTTLTRARAVLAPLQEIGTLGVMLNSTGLLQVRVRQLSQKIASQYQNTLLGAVRQENQDVEGEDRATGTGNTAVGQIIFEYTIAEPKYAVGLLAANAFQDLETSITSANISGPSATLLRQAAPSVNGAASQTDRVVAANKAMQSLTTQERIAWLNLGGELREEAEFTQPEQGVRFRKLTDEERLEGLMHAYAGVPFDWEQYIATEASASEDE